MQRKFRIKHLLQDASRIEQRLGDHRVIVDIFDRGDDLACWLRGAFHDAVLALPQPLRDLGVQHVKEGVGTHYNPVHVHPPDALTIVVQ